jgi:gamma-glutamylcysteine synthetase
MTYLSYYGRKGDVVAGVKYNVDFCSLLWKNIGGAEKAFYMLIFTNSTRESRG